MWQTKFQTFGRKGVKIEIFGADCKVCVEQKHKPTKISQKFYNFFT